MNPFNSYHVAPGMGESHAVAAQVARYNPNEQVYIRAVSDFPCECLSDVQAVEVGLASENPAFYSWEYEEVGRWLAEYRELWGNLSVI